MALLEAIFLGIIQGILEWLPVSSQGNLVLLMMTFFGLEKIEALNLSVYFHLGTTFSVMLYFREDFLRLIRKFSEHAKEKTDKSEHRLIFFLFLATITTGVIGYPIFLVAEFSPFYGEIFIAFVGIALIITGVIRKMATSMDKRRIGDVRSMDALIAGVVQGLSAFPGISRSGMTTSALLFRGFNTQDALKLSFMMSVPAVLLAELGLGISSGFATVDLAEILVGCGAAFLSGLLAIHVLMKVAEKVNFWVFCVIIGVLALLPLISLTF